MVYIASAMIFLAIAGSFSLGFLAASFFITPRK